MHEMDHHDNKNYTKHVGKKPVTESDTTAAEDTATPPEMGVTSLIELTNENIFGVVTSTGIGVSEKFNFGILDSCVDDKG